MSSRRRLAASLGISAAIMVVGAPAIASADSDDGGSTASPVEQPPTSGDESAVDPSTESDPSAATSSVTVPSTVATGAAESPNATDNESSAPEDQPVPTDSITTPTADEASMQPPESSADGQRTDSSDAPWKLTATETGGLGDGDQVPYGKHALRDAGGSLKDAPATLPAEEPTDAEIPSADTPFVEYIDWLESDEKQVLESISAKDAEIGPAEPTAGIGAGTLPSSIEAALVLTTATGAAAVAARRENSELGGADAVTLRTATVTDDPDNRFWNSFDSDWGAGWAEWADSVDATPPAGTSYSVGEDGLVTIHNDSIVDIAIVDAAVWSEQNLVVIRPGESHTIDDSDFRLYWVQVERQNGKPVVIAQVITIAGQVMVAPATTGGYPEQSDFLALHGTTPGEVIVVDPDDRFLDPDDYAALGGNGIEFTNGNPEAAGVFYSVVDDEHIAIHNDGTRDIAVTRATPGGQLLEFDVLAPGETKVYGKVPGSNAIVSVQAERDADGNAVLLGGVGTSTVDGSVIGTSPATGFPAIPMRDVPLPLNHAPAGEVVAQPKPAAQRERVYVVNAFDIDGDTLSYSVHTAPARGILLNNGDGSFTYTPTDPDDLHEGWVDDSFFIEISDGEGGTALAYGDVYYSFPGGNVNAPPEVSTTGGQTGNGQGTWTMTVTDADGDSITGGSVSTGPTHGTVHVSPVLGEPDPVSGAYPTIPGRYTVTYEPDLERAHDSAYDDQFTVTFNDGHGGVVHETVTVHVPEYNQGPNPGGEAGGENPLDPEDPSDPGSGSGEGGVTNPNPPQGGSQPVGENTIHSGSVVGVITVDPQYVINVVLSDPDGDVVTIASVTTSNGGTAIVQGDQIIYTPRATAGYYYEDVTFVVDDGRGGQTTTVERIFVGNTAALPWIPDHLGVVLMISALPGGSDEEAITRRAFDDGTEENYLAFVGMLSKYSLGDTVAGYPALLDLYLTVQEGEGPGGTYTEAQVQQISLATGLSHEQVRMLEEWAANGIDVLSVLLGIDSARDLVRQISQYREVADLAHKRNLDAFIIPTFRQIADQNPAIRSQYFATRTTTDRLWNQSAALRLETSSAAKFAVKRLGAVGTVVGVALLYEEFTTAETPRDYAHASVEALATAAPVIGLVGCAFGPLGCVVGYSVGTAAGFGLSGGNAIARAWWDTWEE